MGFKTTFFCLYKFTGESFLWNINIIFITKNLLFLSKTKHKNEKIKENDTKNHINRIKGKMSFVQFIPPETIFKRECLKF